MAYPNHATLIAALQAHAGNNKRGFTFMGKDNTEEFYSFDRLRLEAMRRAAHLRAAGLKQGDRLALVMPDGEDFIPTFFGAVWAGIIPVPLYPPLALGKLDSYMDALAAILNSAEPTFLATNAKLETVLWSGAARVPSLKGVLVAEQLRKDPPANASQEPASVNAGDICFLQFTSGSTATPKGVMVTHGSLRANAWAIMRDGLQSDPETDRGVSWLPLYHDMGLIGFVLAPTFHDVSVTFIPTLSFIRNATIWLDVISRHKGTISFAPNFAYSLAVKRAKPEQIKKWDLSRMKAFGCGAEPINPATMRKFVEAFAPAGLKPESLLPCYGMAEATLAISFITLDQQLSTDVIERERYQAGKRAEPAHVDQLQGGEALEFVNCGKSFTHHEVAAFDDAGTKLKDRQVGELWVKGPSVAAGYWRNAEATEKTFGGGWLRTGDLGYLANGNVYITGRKKDLIIINGRNYDPQRIEWVADEVPEVRRGSTVAFSVPGSSSEEMVVVVESRTQKPEELKQLVKDKVNEALGLLPADVVIAAPGSLPKTSSGKLQRAKTRQQYLDKSVGQDGNRSLGGGGETAVVAKHVALSLLGRSRHRARVAAKHALEVRTPADALVKLKLVSDYFRGRVTRLFA
ncbi:MAG: fatty acyl-AMP ligase [Myxococcaceae bacterium]